jgi:predicted RNA-binding protein with PIN domain
MPLLIDGHNLIGSGTVPGISLDNEHDELELVRQLRRYRSRVRSDITVVFDGGIPGGMSRQLSRGGVNVVFAFVGQQRADDIIMARVRDSSHPNGLTVVTSDSRLAQGVRSLGAQVTSSADFADRLLAPLPSPERSQEESPLAEAEVDEWLSFFGEEV